MPDWMQNEGYVVGQDWSYATKVVAHLFGRKIRDERKGQGYTQKKLVASAAEKSVEFMGAGPDAISRIEAGQIVCTPEKLAIISEVLGEGKDPNKLLRECTGMVDQLTGNLSAAGREAEVLFVAVDAVKKAGDELNNLAENRKAELPSDPTEDEKKIVAEIQRVLKKGISDYQLFFLPVDEGGEQQTTVGCSGHELVCVIDGIDGVRNYSRNIPLYCVALGIARSDGNVLTPICGVVLNVPGGEWFVALSGGGAVSYTDRTKRLISLTPTTDYQLEGRVIGAHLSTSDFVATEGFVKELLKQLPLISQRLTMLNSGNLALSYVAAGRLDAFLNPNTRRYESVFPGSVILQAAAKKQARQLGRELLVTDFNGSDWALGSENVLASGNPYLHELLLAIIRMLMRMTTSQS